PGVRLEEAHGHAAYRRSQGVPGRRGVGGEAEDRAEERLVVQSSDAAEVSRVGKLRLLVSVAQRRPGAEPVGVEAGHSVELVAKPLGELAEDADAGFAPGAGNDELVDVRAIDAVEARRLVVDVDDADGHEDEPAAQVDLLAQEAVEIGLLDLDLALVGGRADGVLDFDFRVEAE